MSTNSKRSKGSTSKKKISKQSISTSDSLSDSEEYPSTSRNDNHLDLATSENHLLDSAEETQAKSNGQSQKSNTISSNKNESQKCTRPSGAKQTGGSSTGKKKNSRKKDQSNTFVEPEAETLSSSDSSSDLEENPPASGNDNHLGLESYENHLLDSAKETQAKSNGQSQKSNTISSKKNDSQKLASQSRTKKTGGSSRGKKTQSSKKDENIIYAEPQAETSSTSGSSSDLEEYPPTSKADNQLGLESFENHLLDSAKETQDTSNGQSQKSNAVSSKKNESQKCTRPSGSKQTRGSRTGKKTKSRMKDQNITFVEPEAETLSTSDSSSDLKEYPPASGNDNHLGLESFENHLLDSAKETQAKSNRKSQKSNTVSSKKNQMQKCTSLSRTKKTGGSSRGKKTQSSKKDENIVYVEPQAETSSTSGSTSDLEEYPPTSKGANQLGLESFENHLLESAKESNGQSQKSNTVSSKKNESSKFTSPSGSKQTRGSRTGKKTKSRMKDQNITFVEPEAEILSTSDSSSDLEENPSVSGNDNHLGLESFEIHLLDSAKETQAKSNGQSQKSNTVSSKKNEVQKCTSPSRTKQTGGPRTGKKSKSRKKDQHIIYVEPQVETLSSSDSSSDLEEYPPASGHNNHLGLESFENHLLASTKVTQAKSNGQSQKSNTVSSKKTEVQKCTSPSRTKQTGGSRTGEKTKSRKKDENIIYVDPQAETSSTSGSTSDLEEYALTSEGDNQLGLESFENHLLDSAKETQDTSNGQSQKSNAVSSKKNVSQELTTYSPTKEKGGSSRGEKMQLSKKDVNIVHVEPEVETLNFDELLESSSTLKKPSGTQSEAVVNSQRDLRSDHKYNEFIYNSKRERVFSIEVFIDWYNDDPEYYEQKLDTIFSDFSIPRENRVGGNDRLSYVYLLLDPRKFSDSRSIDWMEFIESVFYIGKGKNKRAYNHTDEAERNWQSGDQCSHPKAQRIHDIWETKKPVMILTIFENIVSENASTRKACMIDAIGKRRLCNKICGSYYGTASTLMVREKRELGAILLVKARREFMKLGAERVYPKSWSQSAFVNDKVKISDEYDYD